MTRCLKPMALAAGLALAFPLCASAANPVQDGYRAAAKQEDSAFKDFSTAAGQKLYGTKVGDLACASCHTDSPLAAGKHAKTNKEILPLAPAANPKRLLTQPTLKSGSSAIATTS